MGVILAALQYAYHRCAQRHAAISAHPVLAAVHRQCLTAVLVAALHHVLHLVASARQVNVVHPVVCRARLVAEECRAVAPQVVAHQAAAHHRRYVANGPNLESYVRALCSLAVIALSTTACRTTAHAQNAAARPAAARCRMRHAAQRWRTIANCLRKWVASSYASRRIAAGQCLHAHRRHVVHHVGRVDRVYRHARHACRHVDRAHPAVPHVGHAHHAVHHVGRAHRACHRILFAVPVAARCRAVQPVHAVHAVLAVHAACLVLVHVRLKSNIILIRHTLAHRDMFRIKESI